MAGHAMQARIKVTIPAQKPENVVEVPNWDIPIKKINTMTGLRITMEIRADRVLGHHSLLVSAISPAAAMGAALIRTSIAAWRNCISASSTSSTTIASTAKTSSSPAPVTGSEKNVPKTSASRALKACVDP